MRGRDQKACSNYTLGIAAMVVAISVALTNFQLCAGKPVETMAGQTSDDESE
jgi:hypothetical protein